MMTNSVYAIVAVSAILFVICLLALRKTGLRLAEIQKEKDDIVGEEQRMFDFLHLLGQAIEKDITSDQLYKEIVDGFSNVLSADGGVIYLLNDDRLSLVPKYISPGCPPLVGDCCVSGRLVSS